ncbi:MAG: AAA family ATPase [Spirochaetota bacterium]
MPLHPALIRRRFLGPFDRGLDVRDRLDGATQAFRIGELDPVLFRALPRERDEFSAWIFAPVGTGKVQVAPTLATLPSFALFEGIHVLLDRLRSIVPVVGQAAELKGALEELLLDARITDADKLLILGTKLGDQALPSVLAAIPAALHAELAERLGLKERWLDAEGQLEERDSLLSEAFLSPEELVDLQAARPKAVAELEERRRLAEEARKRREEEERRRIAEERRLAEEERLRVEQARREREEALRRALTLGRNKSESTNLVMTEEFQRLFDLVEGGTRLLYVTGKPGTGKSTLIRALRDHLSSRNVVLVSFTGLAAINIGGQTINSFFMMPPAPFLPLGWTKDNYTFRRRAKALEVLIVDEVSMLRPDMLDAMDSTLRAARGDPRSFGGVQVLLIGDLYQLPPVLGRDEEARDYFQKTYGGIRWFYSAKVFETVKPKALELTRVFRQEAGDFLEFLSEPRESKLSGERLDWFNAEVRKEPEFSDSVFYLTVTPHRETAARLNRQRLDMLPGTPRTYRARFERGGTSSELESPDSKNPGEFELELKPGAQVMFIKNDEGRQWVNGDLGIVEDLDADWVRVTSATGTHRVGRASWPVVKYDIDPASGRLLPLDEGAFIQFPLRLSWASTIHKMQGQTVDRIRIDLTGDPFESGMTYVALSRSRTLAGIRLTRPLVQGDLISDESIPAYLASLERA